MNYGNISLIFFTFIFFAFLSVLFLSCHLQLAVLERMNSYGRFIRLLISLPLLVSMATFCYWMIAQLFSGEGIVSTSELYYYIIYFAAIIVYAVMCAVILNRNLLGKFKEYVLSSKKACAGLGLLAIIISAGYGYQVYFIMSIALLRKQVE